ADGQEAVKIVDFGIAKAIKDDEGTLTAPGYVTGTPEYMSPEQLLGGTLDQRSDVFALGLLTFRMLTNALPFDPPTPERGFGSTLSDAPRRLDMVAPMRQWPLGLQVVFDKVLARDPEDRFPNAAAFAVALREVVAEWDKTNARHNTTPTLGVNSGGDDATVNARDLDVAVIATGDPLRGVSPGAAGAAGAAGAVADRPVTVMPRRWLVTTAALATVAVAVAMVARFGGDTANGASANGEGDSLRAIAVADTGERADSMRVAESVRAATALRAADSTHAVESTHVADSIALAAATRTTGVAQGTRTARTPSRNEGTASIGGADAANALGARTAVSVIAAIDSIRDAVDGLLLAGDARESPARAATLLSRIDRLLPGVMSAGDSARALLLKANLQEASGNRPRACTTLAQVRALATSTADRNSVRRNSELWSC
ncbi:MAG: protein kinase, partial [Gemmatimonas sp.]